MARPGISKQETFAAANELLGRGIDPTIEQIRGVLGTGSNSTIATFLREWRSLQATSDGELMDESLPSEIVGLMKGLWQRVLGQSEARITKVREEANLQLIALQDEINTYQAEYVQLKQQYHQLESEKSDLYTAKLALEEQLGKKDKITGELNTTIATLSTQLKEKQEYIVELRRLQQQSQENLEHYRETSRVQRQIDQDKHEQQLQQSSQELKTCEQQLLITKHDLQHEKNTIKKMADENEGLRSAIDILNEKISKLEVKAITLEGELTQSKQNELHEKNQLESLQNKYDASINKLSDYDAKNKVQSMQLTTATSEITMLKDQNDRLSREKSEIQQEKALLQGQITQLQEMLSKKEVV